jgi:hypothetical protein
VLLAVLVALVFQVLPRTGSADPDAGSEVPGLVHLDCEGWLYTYHILTDTEGLFDTEKDPACLHNVVREDAGRALRCRTLLMHRLGISNLRELRDWYTTDIERLRGLGYF